MTTPNPRKPDLMRISSGRRVIDRSKAGDRNAQRHTTSSIPGEIAYFQDAQDAIVYVEMLNQHTELKRLEDGIRAIVADLAFTSKNYDGDNTDYNQGYQHATEALQAMTAALLDGEAGA